MYCGAFLCIFGCACYVSPRCHLEFLFAPLGALACFRACIVLFFSVLFSCFFSDVFSSGIWSSFAELSDPSLKELATRLKSTVLASKANGTTDAYRRAFLRWKGFASSKAEMQVFPAKAEHVALYLQHVLDSTQSHAAVDSAIYGIQWAHNLADIPSPTVSPIVHSISRAAKRLIGTRLVNKKEPISPVMISRLVESSNLDNLLELRNVCIFLLTFAGFFRIKEVLHIKYGDVIFHDGYVAINLNISKTDQLRKGNQVVIAKSPNSVTCPVRIFKRYLSQV